MGLKEDWDEFEPKLRRDASTLSDSGDQRRFVDLSIMGFIFGQILKNGEEDAEGDAGPDEPGS